MVHPANTMGVLGNGGMAAQRKKAQVCQIMETIKAQGRAFLAIFGVGVAYFGSVEPRAMPSCHRMHL